MNKSWPTKQLEKILDPNRKITYGILKPDIPCDSPKLMIRTQDYTYGWVTTNDVMKVSSALDSEYKRSRVKVGDIVVTVVGNNVGVSAIVPEEFDGANISRAVSRLAFIESQSSDFHYQLLKSDWFKRFVFSQQTGGAQPVINLNALKKLRFPVPPFPEQQKIATILATWDKAIATTEKLIATSQQQKKALMQQLLTGKKRLVNPETGKVFEGDWEEVKLNKCVKFLNGKRKPIKQEDRANIQGKYPYYGATGIIDYVNDYIFDDEIILLGEDGENILSRVLPHVFVVKGKVWVNNHAHVLKANANMDTNFLCMYLESLDYKRYNSGSAQPKINKAVCEKIPVMVPVLAEQQKIATILTAADREIELLQAKLAHLREEKKALMQQLLTGKRRVKIEHMEEVTC